MRLLSLPPEVEGRETESERAKATEKETDKDKDVPWLVCFRFCGTWTYVIMFLIIHELLTVSVAIVHVCSAFARHSV